MNAIHPFERSGLGVGPFQFVTVVSLPSAGLGEANPTAYNLALREASESARGFGVSLGCCEHCGMPLTHNGVIRDARGHHAVVGLDCVAKCGDAHLGNEAKIRQANIRRARAEALREERRQAWLVANAPRLEREKAERLAREEQVQAEQNARKEALRDLLEPLVAQGTEFHLSLARQLLAGPLSPRQAEYVARAVLGRCTRKNEAAWGQITDRCEAFLDRPA